MVEINSGSSCNALGASLILEELLIEISHFNISISFLFLSLKYLKIGI